MWQLFIQNIRLCLFPSPQVPETHRGSWRLLWSPCHSPGLPLPAHPPAAPFSANKGNTLQLGGKSVLFSQLHEGLLPKWLQLLTLFQPNPRALRLLWWLLSEGHAWSLAHSHVFCFPGHLCPQAGAGCLVLYLGLTCGPESNR